MAGYSGTPLVKKLGIKAAQRVALIGAPEGFELLLGELPDETRLVQRGKFDVAVCFCTRERELPRKIASLKRRMEPAAGLWVAWPKRASGVNTDVSEDVVRRYALEARLVDNKVCAIDETWSGLRLVIRVADRPK